MEKCTCGADMTINKIIKKTVVIKTSVSTGFSDSSSPKYRMRYEKIHVCPECGEHIIKPEEYDMDPYVCAEVLDKFKEKGDKLW